MLFNVLSDPPLLHLNMLLINIQCDLIFLLYKFSSSLSAVFNLLETVGEKVCSAGAKSICEGDTQKILAST